MLREVTGRLERWYHIYYIWKENNCHCISRVIWKKRLHQEKSLFCFKFFSLQWLSPRKLKTNLERTREEGSHSVCLKRWQSNSKLHSSYQETRVMVKPEVCFSALIHFHVFKHVHDHLNVALKCSRVGPNLCLRLTNHTSLLRNWALTLFHV